MLGVGEAFPPELITLLGLGLPVLSPGQRSGLDVRLQILLIVA